MGQCQPQTSQELVCRRKSVQHGGDSATRIHHERSWHCRDCCSPGNADRFPRGSGIVNLLSHLDVPHWTGSWGCVLPTLFLNLWTQDPVHCVHGCVLHFLHHHRCGTCPSCYQHFSLPVRTGVVDPDYRSGGFHRRCLWCWGVWMIFIWAVVGNAAVCVGPIYSAYVTQNIGW